MTEDQYSFLNETSKTVSTDIGTKGRRLAEAERVHLRFIQTMYSHYGHKRPPTPIPIRLSNEIGMATALYFSERISIGNLITKGEKQGFMKEADIRPLNLEERTLLAGFQAAHETGHYLHHRYLRFRGFSEDKSIWTSIGESNREIIAELGAQIFVEKDGKIDLYLKMSEMFKEFWPINQAVSQIKDKEKLLIELAKKDSSSEIWRTRTKYKLGSI